jgi:hypothetical protein
MEKNFYTMYSWLLKLYDNLLTFRSFVYMKRRTFLLAVMNICMKTLEEGQLQYIIILVWDYDDVTHI